VLGSYLILATGLPHESRSRHCQTLPGFAKLTAE
jgi:hypothetical protein